MSRDLDREELKKRSTRAETPQAAPRLSKDGARRRRAGTALAAGGRRGLAASVLHPSRKRRRESGDCASVPGDTYGPLNGLGRIQLA